MPILGLEEDAPLRMDKRRGLRGLGARGGALTYVKTKEEAAEASEKYAVELERQAVEKTGLTAAERAARYKVLKAEQIAAAEAKKAEKEEWRWLDDFVLKVKAFFGMQ